MAGVTIFYTLYAHLGTDATSGITVKKNQTEKRAQKIGTGGNSGVKTKQPGRDGSHLHFEYLVDASGIATTNQMLAKGNKRKVSKDPETEFFRRAFFEQPDPNKGKKPGSPKPKPFGIPLPGTEEPA